MMWRSVLLALVCVLALAGCGSAPLTRGQAQATAEAGGCWPYGVRQPLPPTPRPPTATPRIQRPDAPNTATPVTTATAWAIYPTCTPAPLTPTVTPVPTDTPRPYVPPTPQPPAAISSAHEIQDATGVVKELGLSWAYNPRAQGPVIAWIASGWRPESDWTGDGQIWVTSRGARGGWRDPQTVNTSPVIRNYGALALAAAPSGELRLLYGNGMPDSGMPSPLYEVISTDDGVTWSTPRAITDGSAQALRTDSAGGWHALVIGPQPFYSQLRYGYAPPGSDWRWTDISPARDEYRADLALLELGGRITRMIVATRAGTQTNPEVHLHLYRSEDGVRWDRAAQAEQAAGGVDNPTTRPRIIAVARGDGLVAAAWSNYGSGMVVASISTDGGRSFGPSEVIAQHAANRSISPEWDYGIEPSLAYDPEADALVTSWNEIETGAGEVFPWPVRSYRAWRPLDQPLGQPWLGAVIPDSPDQPHPVLDRQRRTYLYATADGEHAGLIIIDDRNYQWRVSYREVHLPALTTQAES